MTNSQRGVRTRACRVETRLDTCSRVLIAALALAATTSAATLVDAARQSHLSLISTLLKQHADVNTPGPDGMTALDWAARSNDLAIARLLIDAGANVKFANRY